MKETKNHSIDLEEAIIGGILIDKVAILKVLEIIKTPNVFFDPKLSTIYDNLLSMISNNEPIDLLTVSNKLERNKKLDSIGGSYYLVELTNKITSTAHIESHCGIVQQFYIKRELLRYSQVLQEKSLDESLDVFNIIDGVVDFVDKINNQISTEQIVPISDITKSIIDNASIKKVGVTMPLKSMGKASNGWHDSNLIIIGARPGMGKSAYLNSIAMSSNVPVGIFSLEMSKEELVKRMFAYITGVPNWKIQKNITTQEEQQLLRQGKAKLDALKITINDKAGISLNEIKTKAKIMVKLNGVKLIIIDYLQLITVKSNNNNLRENDISAISRGLKGIAKDLNVPIIALSQLSRNLESRIDKRPQLSDLRESGAIEQDADVIQFIYRPEYYGLEVWDDDNLPTKNEAEIIVAKDRNGVLKRFRSAFIPERQKFCDISDKFIYSSDTDFSTIQDISNFQPF